MVSENSDFETKKIRSIRNELREVDLLLEDVLIYRSCRENQDASERYIDAVAEEEISPGSCRYIWTITNQLASEMMVDSYNEAIKKLKALPENHIPERESKHEFGPVSMHDKHEPSIARHTETHSEIRPETHTESIDRPRHLTSYYEELTENAAILGYHLETLAREPSEPINEDDLEPHPKAWMY